MINFDAQLNSLPNDVKSYLVSMKASELNVFIAKENGLELDESLKLTEIISNLFFKNIKVVDLPTVIKKEFDFDDLDAKLLACDIVGIRLLVIKDWLKEDLETYIKNWGGNPAEYSRFIDDQKKALAEEEKYFNEVSKTESEFIFKPKPEVIDHTLPEVNEEQEKNDTISLFSHGLVDLLKDDSAQEFIAEYNLMIIGLIIDDKLFKQSLETTLYSNSEELTSGHLLIEEREVSPTIANWIKDFIKINGSEMFDELSLAEYLSTSINAKKLTPAEKEMLRKLLKLYRNLAFFPESLESEEVSDWQIIPVDKDEAEDNKGFVDALSEEKKSKSPVITSPLAELEQTLAKCSPGSFEYKVVAQEIERLKKKK